MATHGFLSGPNTLHVCVYASDGDRIQATIAYASGNTSPNRHTHTNANTNTNTSLLAPIFAQRVRVNPLSDHMWITVKSSDLHTTA